jgi:pyruvate/2-oxoglutarate/acetoin dehydrogenase E1 component
MPELEFRTALREAMDAELTDDERVVIFGEDVAFAGGVYQVTRGLFEKHGPERVFDTPISELAMTGCAFGSAVMGLRPVVEIMYGDFFPLSMDVLVNQASKYWYMSNEQASVPLVVRGAVGAGGRFGPIHSQIPAPWFLGVAGLKIVAPSTPQSAYSLLRAAIRDENPVLFLEHKRLYGIKGDVEYEVGSLGRAAVVRPGTDLTVVAAMNSVHEALAAADRLALDGIELEVIDLQTIRPLDIDTVLASTSQTRRLLVVEEGPSTGGYAAGLVALAAERDGPPLEHLWRLTLPDLPIPFSGALEDAMLPGRDRIVSSVLERLGKPASHSSGGVIAR